MDLKTGDLIAVAYPHKIQPAVYVSGGEMHFYSLNITGVQTAKEKNGLSIGKNWHTGQPRVYSDGTPWKNKIESLRGYYVFQRVMKITEDYLTDDQKNYLELIRDAIRHGR